MALCILLETEMIQGEIESPELWKHNLMQLAPESNWVVSVDDSTGKINITPE